MNASTKQQIEKSAVLNLIPYLDTTFITDRPMTLNEIVTEYADQMKHDDTFKLLQAAIKQDESLGNIQLINQSSTNNTAAWTDDLIQGCTFMDPSTGDYYVAFRGTGDGRWADNGNGMTAPSTEMQEAAAAYFDQMAEEYLIDASVNGSKIFVTGHSKGGNEAQYVYMTAQHEEIIDACYSLDGQGFSGSAIEHFQDIHGKDYDDKLQNMYSVNGENDFVHDLGYVIIPEDNTYFVPTSEGKIPNSWHALENMLASDDNGTWNGLSWAMDGDTVLHGEQGEIGALTKKISEMMMKLDDEDLNGAAIAVMSFIDPYSNDDILGSINISWTDYVDLIAHGLPVALQAVFLTPEGNAVLQQLISSGAEYLYEHYGTGGIVAGLVLTAVGLVIAAPLVLDIVVICKVLDFAIDTFNNVMNFVGKISDFVADIKDFVVKTVQKIVSKVNSWTAGGKYAAANPKIVVDTYKLTQYASRLQEVNRRISRLDRRLDSLYWQVGLLGLWNLMQADLLTGYSWRLLRAASYLNETASDFSKAEQELVNNLQ